VKLHPKRPEIISGDQNGSVKVWDLTAGKCINELSPDDTIDYDQDDNDPSSATDNRKSSSNTTTTTYNNPSSRSYSSSSTTFGQAQKTSIQAVDVSEDGRTCIAANNHAHVFVWDPSDSTNFQPLCKFQAHRIGSYLLAAKISPDNRQLVTCSSDRTARLFDISRDNDTNAEKDMNGFQPEVTQTLAQHTKWVWDAVFSADSSYLVTASSDHSARLWNLRTGDVVKQYTGHEYAVTCVALNDSST